MKYPYSFYFSEIGTLLIDLPSQLLTIEHFLVTDLSLSNCHLYLKLLDETLTGFCTYHKISGNTSTLEIFPDVTKVYNHYIEEIDYCTIETSELKELILLFIKEISSPSI